MIFFFPKICTIINCLCISITVLERWLKINKRGKKMETEEKLLSSVSTQVQVWVASHRPAGSPTSALLSSPSAPCQARGAAA